MNMFIVFDKEKSAQRLAALRKERGTTQKGLAMELHKCLYPDDKDLVTFSDKETYAISQMEHHKSVIQPNKLFAYAHICDTTCDYILGRTDNKRPEHRSIQAATGLTEEAIRALQYQLKHDGNFMYINDHEQTKSVVNETYEFINVVLGHYYRFLLYAGQKTHQIRTMPKDVEENQKELIVSSLKYSIVTEFTKMLDEYINQITNAPRHKLKGFRRKA